MLFVGLVRLFPNFYYHLTRQLFIFESKRLFQALSDYFDREGGNTDRTKRANWLNPKSNSSEDAKKSIRKTGPAPAENRIAVVEADDDDIL
jgi:hypothetical protein